MPTDIDSILVPTDGSEGAEVGAQHGVALAAAVGAELHTISVVEADELTPALSRLDDDEQTEPHRRLEAAATSGTDTVAELAAPSLDAQVTTAVEFGHPAESILAYVEDHGIDLIVMGTHGRRGLERLVLGSVAERVLRTASVPVVMVPPGAAVDGIEEIDYSDLVVPTDGSQPAEAGVEWGLWFAAVADATVHTVYSVDTSRFAGEGAMSVVYDALESVGREALDSVRDRARADGIGVSAKLGAGPPASVIDAYCDDCEADMIVMGTHGRSGLERFLVGSVTEAVVRRADVPVCCVPATTTQ